MCLNRKLPMVVMLINLLGIVFSLISGAIYFVMKLIYWDSFQAGIAPLLLLLLIFMFAQSMLFAQIWVLIFALEKQAGGEGLEFEKFYDKKRKPPVHVGIFLKFSSFLKKSYIYFPVVGSIGIFGTLAVIIYFLILKIKHWNEFILGVTPAILIVCILIGTLVMWGGVMCYYLLRVLSFFQKKDIPLAVVEEKINFN